jgi:hypothetical protein
MEPGQVVVPILVFGLGVLTTIGVQSYFRKLADETALINDLIGDIDRIEDLATRYWLAGRLGPVSARHSEDDDRELAAQIRGAVHATGCFQEHADKVLAKRAPEFRTIDGKIFDLTTGGGFETKDREPDLKRVVAIMEACNEMRFLLRTARWQKLWAH